MVSNRRSLSRERSFVVTITEAGGTSPHHRDLQRNHCRLRCWQLGISAVLVLPCWRWLRWCLATSEIDLERIGSHFRQIRFLMTTWTLTHHRLQLCFIALNRIPFRCFPSLSLTRSQWFLGALVAAALHYAFSRCLQLWQCDQTLGHRIPAGDLGVAGEVPWENSVEETSHFEKEKWDDYCW